jgi:hypothetical protein
MRRIARQPAVDWFRILAELRRHDFTQVKVAKELQIPRSRVRDWAAGMSPRYEDGRALIMLWRLVCIRMSENRQRKSVQSGNGRTDAHDAEQCEVA